MRRCATIHDTDKPIPMLGDMSPRAAARDARGRRNVAAWLKYIGNRSCIAPDQSEPTATYDVSWLWRVLKVEQLRS
jgi:hypothetical protein